ncbi:unnamed protein product [Oikopleura dioica]|uniref:Uncharacterized protein n=1 Tax=Oikopleura dioica TaxID=34765 RepID=E4XZS3_OIKDI|nr:unnamed protein product [Oikopleura dioica]
MLREDLPTSAAERKTTKRTMTILKAKKKSLSTKLKESSEVNSLPILTEKKQTILMQTKWTASFLEFSKNSQVATKRILVTRMPKTSSTSKVKCKSALRRNRGLAGQNACTR